MNTTALIAKIGNSEMGLPTQQNLVVYFRLRGEILTQGQSKYSLYKLSAIMPGGRYQLSGV